MDYITRYTYQNIGRTWTGFMWPTIITGDVLFFNTFVKYFHKLREFVGYVTTYCPLKHAAPKIISYYIVVIYLCLCNLLLNSHNDKIVSKKNLPYVMS